MSTSIGFFCSIFIVDRTGATWGKHETMEGTTVPVNVGKQVAARAPRFVIGNTAALVEDADEQDKRQVSSQV